jgi:hypothetical protein
MRLASTFTANYKAYIASQKQSRSDNSSVKRVENYEMASEKISPTVTGAGPCVKSIFDFTEAGPCNSFVPDFAAAGPCNTAPKH